MQEAPQQQQRQRWRVQGWEQQQQGAQEAAVLLLGVRSSVAWVVAAVRLLSLPALGGAWQQAAACMAVYDSGGWHAAVCLDTLLHCFCCMLNTAAAVCSACRHWAWAVGGLSMHGSAR